MAALTARLLDGRFVVDDPTDDGPKLTLVLEESEDVELDAEEQARLDAFLDRSIASADRGELIPAEQVLAKLRALRLR